LIGHVDEALRALLDVSIRQSSFSQPVTVTTWIDTAFNGYLVFPLELIEKLGLQKEAETDAILADGTLVTLASYACFVEWFGKLVKAQVIANDGKLPLLGTELMRQTVLVVDYKALTVSLDA
jgi:clan AA aspartic protease